MAVGHHRGHLHEPLMPRLDSLAVLIKVLLCSASQISIVVEWLSMVEWLSKYEDSTFEMWRAQKNRSTRRIVMGSCSAPPS